ncbi:MAG: hypothetical protein ACK4VV_00190 [Pseudomonas sp.]
MNIQALRDRVSKAEQQEQLQTGLRGWLQPRVAVLHPSIAAGDDVMDSLYRFVSGYIAQVPDMLEAAQSVAERTGTREQMLPVLKVAEAFFLQPPDLPQDHQGMLALLDEAYLAHRLVEEVNDRYIAHGGQALVPLDATRANLIAHQLLGEPFANELDDMVAEAVETLAPESLFASASFDQFRALAASGPGSPWEEWPCLSRQLGVDIRLRGADDKGFD